MTNSTIRRAGEAAPPLSAQAEDGRTITLDDMLDASSGSVYLYWIKTGCPTCKLAAPYVDRLSKTAPGRVRVVVQDDHASISAFRQQYDLTVDMVQEAAPYGAADQYGITHLPTWFVVERDASGSSVVRDSGMMFSQDDLQAHHEALGGTGQLFTDAEADRLPPSQPG